jgi:5-methylcytosine-specific restriction protein A
MPMRAPTACSAQPCKNPAAPNGRGRCLQHMRQANRERSTDAYDSTWRRFRRMVLAERPLCADCERQGLIVPATELHHERPVRERPDLRLVESNVTGLCKPCHSKRTAAEMGWGA